MRKFKILLRSLFFSFFVFLFLSFMLTIFNYFDVVNYKIVNIIKIIIPIVSVFMGGIYKGKGCDKNGWLEGVKFSSLISIFFILITLFFDSFKHEYIYYLLIIVSSGILGSIIGINYK